MRTRWGDAWRRNLGPVARNKGVSPRRGSCWPGRHAGIVAAALTAAGARRHVGIALEHARFVLGLSCLGLALWPCTVLAQQIRGIDVDPLRLAPDASGFLSLAGTYVPDLGRWSLAHGHSLAWAPFSISDPDENRQSVVDMRWNALLAAQVGLGARTAVAVDMPFMLYQLTDSSQLRYSGPELAKAAVGDLRLRLRTRLWGSSHRATVEQPRACSLAFAAAVTAPSGEASALAGEAGWTTHLATMIDFYVLRWLGGSLELGWLHRYEQVELGGVRYRDDLQVGLGFKLPIGPRPNLGAIIELHHSFDARAPWADWERARVELDAGLRILRGQLAWTVALGSGLSADGAGSPLLRALVSVHAVPHAPDQDHDGIPDKFDECARLAEDHDGYQDEDGCLDPDNDLDFVDDVDDKCPNDPAEEGRDEDMDGCTDPA